MTIVHTCPHDAEHWRLSLSTVGGAPAKKNARARSARAIFGGFFYIFLRFWAVLEAIMLSFFWHWPEERTHTYTAQRLTQTWLNKAGQQFPYLPEVLVVQLSSTALRWGYCVFESSRPVTKATSFSPWQSQVTKKMTHC